MAQAEGSASEADTAGEKGASKEGEGKEKSRLNSIRLSGVYAHHRLHHRNSQTTGEPLDTRENLGGFEIAYERELIEEHLSIEFAKPFFFSPDSFETPFEVTLKGLFVKGSWEGYIGAIFTFNIRWFSQQRAEFEGQKNVLSFGVELLDEVLEPDLQYPSRLPERSESFLSAVYGAIAAHDLEPVGELPGRLRSEGAKSALDGMSRGLEGRRVLG